MKKVIASLTATVAFVVCCMFGMSAYAAQSITADDVTLSDTSYTYTAKAVIPGVTVTVQTTETVTDESGITKNVTKKVTLKKDKNYTVSYKNNVNVGTATVTVKGKGDYTGSAEKTFKIKARSFSDSAVKVTNTKTIVGKTASPIVKYNGNTLKIDNDYTVSMKNNKKTGISSATITITGKGNFKGSRTYKVHVYPAKVKSVKVSDRTTNSFKLTWKSQSADKVSGYKVYKCDVKGKNLKYITTVTTNSAKIKNLNPGYHYCFVVRSYKTEKNSTVFGDYSSICDTATKPAKVKLNSVVSKSKKLNIKWKQVTADGYEIQYARDRNFKKNVKKVRVGKSSSKTIKVGDKKAYYVRVRAYRKYNSNKGTVYGAWSKTLSSNSDYDHVYATFTTSYSNSSSNRCNNIQTAAKYINGTVLMPGETFSFDKVVGKRTTARGFKEAPVFTGGSGHGMGVGGGVCQVSTTVFNAALLANLNIVERHQHSQKVGYVPYGRDAAISWGTKNFRFKNNTKYPIKIKMTTKNKKLTCTLAVCEDVKPKKVSLKVNYSGGKYVLKRYVGGKCNYSTSSKY